MGQSNLAYLLLQSFSKMKFNNIKLSAGILYVGIIVSSVLLSLYLDLSRILISYLGDTLKTAYIYFLLVLIVTLPLDILASKKLNTPKDSRISKILVSNCLLFLIFIFFINMINIVFKIDNVLFAFIFSILLQISILVIQEIITNLIFKPKKESFNNSSLLIIKDAPSYMTMNIIQTLRGSKIIVPEHWTKHKHKNYQFHLKRFELIENKKIYTKSIFFSIIVNAIFFTLIYFYYINTNVSSVYFIINLSLICNLISFLYILVLPILSQNGITNTDNIMKNKDSKLFQENLLIFENNQDKNKTRGKIVERIFYPIPSIETRVNSDYKKKFALSNVSRLIIMFASSSLSIIFKGVHGNAGKPENWLLPPSE